MTGAALVAEARTWTGTPFEHWTRVKGVACDCGGLILGAAAAVGLPVRDLPAMARPTDPAILLEYVLEFCDPAPGGLADLQPGDVLLFAFQGQAVHLGIATGEGTLIHAYETVGKVVEQPFDRFWRSRCVAVYRGRGLDG